jgi:hypothetical protein
MRGFGGIKQRANEKVDSQKLPANRFDNFDIDGFRFDGWIAFCNKPHHDARFANSISIKIRNDAPNQHNNNGVNNIFQLWQK